MANVFVSEWSLTMADIARMNEKQLKEARKLIKKRCCNYDQGSCIILDWSFCNICPQYNSYSVLCKWFRDAVLPITKNWKERSMQISPVHIAVLFVNAGLLQPVPEASIALSVPSLCDGNSRQNGCGERERKCRHFRPNFRCGATTFLHDF